MRKGLWSPDEDEKLRDCIAQHRSGSWSDIARKAGLQRCGKSCRRRWMNHLRPDLKREKFSAEEVKLVAKLHETMGNKWSEIATYLVGRTDNDVKNLWNTQIKKQIKNGHYDSNVTSTSRHFNGFFFGMDSIYDSMEHPCIEMTQQLKGNGSTKANHMIANSLSSIATYPFERNSRHHFDENAQHHDHNDENKISLLRSLSHSNNGPREETTNQYVRLGAESFCSLLVDEGNIIDNIGDYSPRMSGSTSQFSLNDSTLHTNHSPMRMETIARQHQSDSNVSTSHASLEAAGSSNNSSTGTLNVGDDISSVCKPSLFNLQYPRQSEEASGNNEHNNYPKYEEEDVTILSTKESWNSTSYCDQWPLETLIGYCDSYPQATWP